MESDFRWLFQQCRPFLWSYVLSAASGVIAGFLALADSLLIKWLMDRALPAHDLTAIILVGIVLLACAAVRLAAVAVGTLKGFSASQKNTLRTRMLLLRQLNRLSLDYHQTVPQGEKLFRVDRDVEQISEIAGGLLTQALTVSFTVLSAVSAVGWLYPKLLLVVIPANAVMLLARFGLRGKLKALYEESQSLGAQVAAITQEHIGVIPQLQLLCEERSQLRRILRMHIARIRLDLLRRCTELAYTSSSGLIVALGTTIVLMAGGYQVVHGRLSAGGLVAAWSLMARLFDPASTAIDLYSHFVRATTSIRRVREILIAERSVQDHLHAVSLPKTFQGRIELRDVAFVYRTEPVLLGLNLQIKPGERIALVGASGSGKTTLAKLIARLHDPFAGKILLDDLDVRMLRLSSVRSQIAYLTHEPLILSMTLRENLLLGNKRSSEESLRKAVHMACLEETVARLPQGLATRLGSQGATLSGGERQRVIIARAFLRSFRVLILDEATSALDIPTEQTILQEIVRKFPEQTIIVISHRIASLSWLPRAVVLSGGSIVEDGRPAELQRLVTQYSTMGLRPDRLTPIS